jgi:hypothetical protein
MIALPRTEVNNITELLYRLPGVDGSDARRTFLNLVFPINNSDDAIPDSAIETGWKSVIEYLAQPPASKAITNLMNLLLAIRQSLSIGELTNQFDEAIDRLHQLSCDRSFPIFLARLGIDIDGAETSGIALLNQVFVPPVQYEKALQIIEHRHVLFFFGDPHMGKTFSALRILWDYFREKSREPYWWRSLISISSSESDINALIKEGATIYIEDPFGRTAPLDDTDAILRIIRRLILEAETRDVRIVITSRTSVLRSAIADRLSDYVITLSQELILEKSYDDEALNCITDNYINSYRPRWINTTNIYDSIQRVVSDLRAPHNIQEFLFATRSVSNAESALSQVVRFQDIVQEYAQVFAKLEEWIVIALVVIAAASDNQVPSHSLAALYDQLYPNRSPYKSFDVAVRSLRDYVNTLPNSQPVPRHPSIEDAVEVLSRRTESLLEANWLIIETCYNEALSRHQKTLLEAEQKLLEKYSLDSSSYFDRIAIQLLVTYADCWSIAPDRLSLLKIYFNNDDLSVRAAARRTVLNRFNELHVEATEIITNLAMKSWGDRFLLQIILHPGSLDDVLYEKLATVLSESVDSQTRYFVAEKLGNGLRIQVLERIVLSLLFDSDWLVRRTALFNILKYLSITSDLEEQIKESVDALPFRHRNWLAVSASDLAAYKQIFITPELSKIEQES